MAIEPELVERFRTDLRAIWPESGQDRIGIAFSGGPDSLALLLLAHAALPGRVEAASVDHGLRAESAGEAAQAATVCEALGIPHAILKVEVAKGNLQSEARQARYAALAEWAAARGIDAVCSAHHADDQAETFLMRANRGSGLAGLSGVRAKTNVPGSDRLLLRPLLGWRRKTLEEIVADSGFQPVQDPSNLDDRFDRVRMRKALKESDFIDLPSIGRSAQMLAEMQASIDAMAREEYARALEEDGAPARYCPFARSQATRTAFLAEVITLLAEAHGAALSRSDAARVVSELSQNRPINIGGLQARATQGGGEPEWLFSPENPRRSG